MAVIWMADFEVPTGHEAAGADAKLKIERVAHQTISNRKARQASRVRACDFGTNRGGRAHD